MSVDLGQNGEEVFAGFVRTLAVTLNEQAFDAIIAAGDSGSAMIGFAQLVANVLLMQLPPVVLLPVFRPDQLNEQALAEQHQTLVSLAKQQLGKTSPENLLLLDDDIYSGTAMRLALEAFQEAAGEAGQRAVLLAEDQGFAADKLALPHLTVDFRPFSKEHDDIPNAIFWFIPHEFEDPIKAALKVAANDGKDHDKWPMLILLNMPIKTRHNGASEFTFDVHRQVANIEPRLSELQAGFQDLLRQKIQAAL